MLLTLDLIAIVFLKYQGCKLILKFDKKRIYLLIKLWSILFSSAKDINTSICFIFLWEQTVIENTNKTKPNLGDGLKLLNDFNT